MKDPRETTRQPGGPLVPGQPAGFDPVGEARDLLRTTRAGTIATLEAGSGAPFATLVSLATDTDGAPLMLLSTLSAHTRHLIADGRCSLLLARGGKGDPLAHPRLTVSGRAAPWERPAARARFLARHPKAALYAGFGDFGLWRIAIEGGHLNGGFARAARLSADEMLTDLAGTEELVAAEAEALAHLNEDHGEALDLYASALCRRAGRGWRATGLDPDGLDLARGDETARLAFPCRVTTPGELRTILKELADRARSAQPLRRRASQ